MTRAHVTPNGDIDDTVTVLASQYGGNTPRLSGFGLAQPSGWTSREIGSRRVNSSPPGKKVARLLRRRGRR